MPASLTASIASLILTVDDPGRDDLSTVKVWASTTNDFTPSDLTLVYTGNSFTILLANLTPLTTYYVKYAYISEIDPTDFDYSAQLSGVPNKIDGSIIVDGSITANQISATALRGKMFVGNVLMDLGTIATSSISATGNPTTTFTLNVLDTVDFPSSGAALIISKTNSFWSSVVRYTGKTSTSFTGVSGIEFASVSIGDAILPIAAHGFATDTNGYPGGTTWETNANGYGFRRASGSALAISPDYVADLFTYTAQGIYTGGLGYEWFTGVSGLSTWSGYSKTIVDNNDLPTLTVATTGTFSTLTINKTNDVRIASTGGELYLVSTTIVGIQTVIYKSYSGTTITLNDSYTIDAATYYVIPAFSITAVGAGLPFVTATNSSENTGHTKIQKIADYQNELGTTNFYGRVYINTIDSSENLPSSTLSINAPRYNGQSVMPLYMGYLEGATLDLTPVQFGGGFGMVDYYGTPSSQQYMPIVWQSQFNTPNYYYLQGMVAQHFFSDPSSPTADSITFDDSTNTYLFNADGSFANANITALRVALGTAVVSSSVSLGITDSMSVNGTRRGIYNQLNITNATLSADRSLYAAQNIATLTSVQNSAAFSHNVYGAYNIAQTDIDSGNSLDNEGRLYGAYNYGLHNTDNATFFRMEDVFGSYNYAQSAGNTSRVDDAYGVYARVVASGTAASPNISIARAYGLYSLIENTGVNRTISTAYNLYIDSTETGTITTKWGIYQANDWPNRFAGDVNLIGGLNLVPTVSVPTTGSTITLTNATTVLCLNHTATIATLTINFPSSPSDGQCISICTRSAVTTLTLGNGTFRGGITTIAANGFVEYIYSATGAAWFRKG